MSSMDTQNWGRTNWLDETVRQFTHLEPEVHAYELGSSRNDLAGSGNFPSVSEVKPSPIRCG